MTSDVWPAWRATFRGGRTISVVAPDRRVARATAIATLVQILEHARAARGRSPRRARAAAPPLERLERLERASTLAASPEST